jgi:hypothetical protein
MKVEWKVFWRYLVGTFYIGMEKYLSGEIFKNTEITTR